MTQSSLKINERAACLYLEVVETPGGAVSSAELEDYHNGDGDVLIDCGLLVHSNDAPFTYTIDDDTTVNLEWFPEQNTYGYFSPVSGIVTVDKEYLRNYQFDGLQFMKRLVSHIDMLTQRGPTEKIEKILWELGEIRESETDSIINIWFARRLQDASTLQKVNNLLKNLDSSRFILLITTSPVSDIMRSELNQYHLIELRELLDQESKLIINIDFLEAKVKALNSAHGNSENESVSKYRHLKTLVIVGGALSLPFAVFSWIYSPSQALDIILYVFQYWGWDAVENDIFSPIIPCPSRLPCASFRGP